MAYFECIYGGRSSGLAFTITCDSDFAGTDITCTDGNTILTKTCPSSSPYTIEFMLNWPR